MVDPDSNVSEPARRLWGRLPAEPDTLRKSKISDSQAFQTPYYVLADFSTRRSTMLTSWSENPAATAQA